MKKCGIYKITNMVNGKVLVGRSKNIFGRWRGYKSELRRNIYLNQHLQLSWNKYGEENFNFEIILICSPEKLDEEEIRLIKEHKSTNREFGYNIEEGGGNSCCAQETKNKMKQSWNYDKHFSEETRKKISKANFGRIMPEEQKLKIGNANKGNCHSLETKLKISKAHLGKKLSEETKKKISQANVGENNPMYMKHHSEEVIQKMKERKLTEETKKKISQAKFGKPLNLSEEARQKRKESKIGEKNSFFGKQHSEETKLKMKEAWRIRKLKSSL